MPRQCGQRMKLIIGNSMIVEYIRYDIPSEQQPAFLAAWRAATEELAASVECLAYELARCTEQPTLHVVRIEWTSLEGHLQGFRKSPSFAQFVTKLQPFFPQILEMRHYLPSDVTARKATAARREPQAGANPTDQELSQLRQR